MKLFPSKDQIVPGIMIALLAMVIANKIPAIKKIVG